MTAAVAIARDAELEELRATVAALAASHAALIARVTVLEAKKRRRRTSAEADDALILAIARAAQSRNFNARELWRHAARVDDELRDAIKAAGIHSAIALGLRLTALEGRVVSGLALERLGDDRDGAIWRIARR